MAKGSSLNLKGNVSPSNATSKDITWTIKDAGTTGATINGNTLSTTGTGTVVVTASSGSFTKDFAISVVTEEEMGSDGGGGMSMPVIAAVAVVAIVAFAGAAYFLVIRKP
jgi:uncharacterized protein YjdB